MESVTGKCPHCGGSNIVGGVRVDQMADAGRIGLSYKTKLAFIFTEAFYANVCDDCGTITRLYVKETGKKWYVK